MNDLQNLITGIASDIRHSLIVEDYKRAEKQFELLRIVRELKDEN